MTRTAVILALFALSLVFGQLSVAHAQDDDDDDRGKINYFTI